MDAELELTDVHPHALEARVSYLARCASQAFETLGASMVVRYDWPIDLYAGPLAMERLRLWGWTCEAVPAGFVATPPGVER